MSLSIKDGAGMAEPNIVQRAAAILGLAGLILAWGVLLIPCLLWLLFSLVAKRLTPLAPIRSQA
jgi:hypothetical protein